MRVIEAAEPAYDRSHHYHEQSPFRARWIAHPDAPGSADFDGMFVARYRLPIHLSQATTVRVHVSADERYTLSLNGRRLGRGPERGDRDHWHFETYDLSLDAGPNELTAVVQSLGRERPYAQVSVRHAFVLLAEGELGDQVSTGVAEWQAERLRAYSPRAPKLRTGFIATGSRFRVDAAALHAEPLAVTPVSVSPFVLTSMRMESPGRWQLAPALLPPMLERAFVGGIARRTEGGPTASAWDALIRDAAPLTIAAHSTATALIDLEDYVCAYSRLSVDGGAGATVRLEWAEALVDANHRKANRSAVDGLDFLGFGDEFLCAGKPTVFEPLWWQAGRYVRLTIVTGDQPLIIREFALTETRYPTQWDTTIEADNPAITSWLPLTRRALEACSHETYFDCPYYEQLMYVGDTRLEALVTHTFSRDDRLPRKAARLFDQSRTADGFTQARYPTKTAQVIPPFSFWWVGMVHDLAMWRDRPDEVARLMPGVRAVMEAGYRAMNGDDLYQPTTGWNFVDWVPDWAGGVPPGGADQPTAPIHFQFAYAASMAAELETIVGEPQLAQRHSDRLRRLITSGTAAFFDPSRNLFADDLAHSRFSEHAQSLALLAGAVQQEGGARQAFGRALIEANDLARGTIYFTHYVLEAYRLLRRPDAFFDRLSFWSGLVDQGFKTTPEQPEPSRSDCHAWGAHPMLHLVATVLGVRPAAAGFSRVRIEPQLGPLQRLAARIVHPRGWIEIEARRSNQMTEAEVRLPPGVTGTLILDGKTHSLGL